MVQVTPKPRDLDPKMGEDKRARDPPGGRTPKPELPTVRYEWPGLPAGPGSDLLVYKPNQRRPGDLPQAIQTVPAIWVPSAQGPPWQYSGVNEETLASQTPALPPPVGWNGTKHYFVCGGIVLLLLLVLSFFDRYRVLSGCLIFRKRRSKGQNTVKLICQIGDKQTTHTLEMDTKDTADKQMPPSYSKIDLVSDAAKDGQLNDLMTPYSCIFTSGKNTVPRLLFYNTRKDKEVMKKLGFTPVPESGAHKQMHINVPSIADENDPNKKTGNFMIEINDNENQSGCIIGMKVQVDKSKDASEMLKDDDIPVSVTIEHMEVVKKKNGDGKK